MNSLDDLKRQLAVICVDYYKYYKDKNNMEYKTAAQLLKDIGEVYQKYCNAGVSLRDMKLLDQVYYDIINDWDRLVNAKDPVEEIEEATPAYLTIGNEEFIFLYGG